MWRRRGWLALTLVVAGCAIVRTPTPAPHQYTEAGFARKRLAAYEIPTPGPGAEPTVVGETTTATVQDGDTLLDIARWYDVGMEEMERANPGVDPWLPKVGSTVVVPTAFVLPCCTYEGMVVNVPEMRLYVYRPASQPGRTVVQTFPLGLGRAEYRTPIGIFRVKGKTVNPAWGVPEKIRLEHIRERGDGRKFIAGGDPDNPLGKYRFELDRTLYRIHGTNMPWGIGRLVSHGCAQLFPEDVAHLFPLVPIGTRVEFVYQSVKLGRRDGDVWIEAHPDVYQRQRGALADLQKALRARGLRVDDGRLRAAVSRTDGVPRLLAAAPKNGRTVGWFGRVLGGGVRPEGGV